MVGRFSGRRMRSWALRDQRSQMAFSHWCRVADGVRADAKKSASIIRTVQRPRFWRSFAVEYQRARRRVLGQTRAMAGALGIGQFFSLRVSLSLHHFPAFILVGRHAFDFHRCAFCYNVGVRRLGLYYILAGRAVELESAKKLVLATRQGCFGARTNSMVTADVATLSGNCQRNANFNCRILSSSAQPSFVLKLLPLYQVNKNQVNKKSKLVLVLYGMVT